MFRIQRFVRPAIVVVAILAMVLACRDSSGPDAGTSVALEAIVTGPTVGPDIEGTTTVSCEVLLQAVGSGVGAATWESLTFLFYTGANRAVPEDTVEIPTESIAEIWGRSEIQSDELQAAQLRFTAPSIFTVTVVARYQPSRGRARTAEKTFSCGPPVTTAAPPPTIAGLTIRPSGSPVQPGETLEIDFSVDAPAGVLAVRLTFSGACEHLQGTREQLETSITRTIAVKVPGLCRLDQPLEVAVTVVDGLLQEATARASVEITDITPPVAAPTWTAGTYLAGERMWINFGASDNNALAAFIWEVMPAGYIDSLTIRSMSTGPVEIAVSERWGEGPVQLRFLARDAAGLTSNSVTTDPSDLRVAPTVSRPTRSVDLQEGIRDLTIDARRGMIYVLRHGVPGISRLSVPELRVVDLIPLPTEPTAFDMTPGGDSLIVLLPEGKTLAVIDLREPAAPPTLIPLTNLDGPDSKTPINIRVTRSGKMFLTAIPNFRPMQPELLEVDLALGTQRFRLDAGSNGRIGNGPLQRSLDGSALVVQTDHDEFQRYDARTDQFGPRRSIESTFATTSVDADGNRIAVGFGIYDEGLLPVSRATPTISSTRAVTVLAPSGDYLYQAQPDQGIIRYRVSDGVLLDRSRIPAEPQLIRVSGDGTFVIAVGPTSSGLSRVVLMELP